MSGTAVLINLLGGIALLLWGLRMVRTGMTRGFGGRIRRVLGHSLDNRFKAFGTGLGVTILLQSSTATALLTASFAGKGMLAAAAGMAVLLGADVGTSLVAQILSFDLSLLIPVALLVGLILFSAAKNSMTKNLGRIALGLGQMLLALRMILEASLPIRESEVAQFVLQSLAGEPILAVLIAAILAYVAHSSLATVLMVMSLAANGTVPIEVAFAIVLGANLGGALLPMTATLGAESSARRPPAGNLAFKVIGVIVVIPFLGAIVDQFALLEMSEARQIVNFHTAFNIGLAVLFLPFVHFAGSLSEKYMPDAPVSEDKEFAPQYLDRSVLDHPQIALANAVRETLRMAEILEGMFNDLQEGLKNNDRALIRKVIETDDIIDEFYTAIKLYLTDVAREPLGDEDSKRCTEIMSFSTNLEHIGDILVLNMCDLADRKAKRDITMSAEDARDEAELFDMVRANLKLSISVLLSGDIDSARSLVEIKRRLRDREMVAVEDHMERLKSATVEAGQASSMHLDFLRDLRRANSHLTSVAYGVLAKAGELKSARERAETQLSIENI